MATTSISDLIELCEQIRTNATTGSNTNELVGATMKGIAEYLQIICSKEGDNYEFQGAATPDTDPGTPDRNVLYITSGAGTYTHFGGLVVPEGSLGILKYNDSWTLQIVAKGLYSDTDSGTGMPADFNPQSDTVWNKPQVLSDIQKQQAQKNIGVDGITKHVIGADVSIITDFIENKSIGLSSYDIGDVVDTTPANNTSVDCICLEVSQGDKFILTGKGASGPRLWGILDADKKLISMAAASATATNLEITIEEDGYIVVNVLRANPYSLYIPAITGLVEQMADVPNQINQAVNESNFALTLTNGFRNSSAGLIVPTYRYRVATDILPSKNHYIKLKAGFIFQTICFYDEDGSFFVGWDTTLAAGAGNVFEMSDFRYNGKYRVAYSIRRITENTSETLSTTPSDLIEVFELNDIVSEQADDKIAQQNGDSDISDSFIGGAYIDLPTTIGSAVTMIPVKNNSAQYAVVQCCKDDIFKVTAIYNGKGKTLAFVDRDYNLVYNYNMSETSTAIVDKIFIAPVDGYLIVNSKIVLSVGTRAFSLTLSSSKILRKTAKKSAWLTPVKWAAFGDSITISYFSYFTETGSGSNGGLRFVAYPYIAAGIKEYNLDNYGVGGTGWVRGNTTQQSAAYVVNAVDFSQYELVTFGFGINDYKTHLSGQPDPVLGSLSDDIGDGTGNNIVANMRYCIEKVLNDNPTCKIIVIMPLNSTVFGTESTNYCIEQVGPYGFTLQELFDAMVEVCEYYGLDYVDFTHKSVINRKNITTLLPDGVHPSLECHKTLARELAAKMQF